MELEYAQEDPEWYFKDVLREEVDGKLDSWTNLGADEAKWIREGGALYIKNTGTGSIRIITNYDLQQAVGGKEAERMAEKEGGRYRIHEVRVGYDQLVEWFESPREMHEQLSSEGYPEPSDVISEVARERETSMNLSNTDNFWDYLKTKYGINPPEDD